MVYNKQQLLGEEWKNKTNAYVPKDAKKKSGGGPFSLVSKASQSSQITTLKCSALQQK